MANLRLNLHLQSQTHLNRPSSSTPPSAYTRPSSLLINPTRNQPYWDSIYTDIHTHLTKSITIREPVTVFEPMHHLTFAPPIATASALCVAACEAVGGQREDAIVAASAIHLMYATIYTHDHLLLSGRVGSEPGSKPGSESVNRVDPSVELETGDGEPGRVGSGRGSEVLHRFSPGVELMTGDGILPYGFELLAGSVAGDNGERVLRVIIEISRAVGSEGMIDGGDDDEVGSDQPSRQLHGCGAACGGILGGGSEEEIERLRRFGVYVGKVQGVLSEKGKSEGVKRELVEKWRGLALKELECFDGKKIEEILSIVNV